MRETIRGGVNFKKIMEDPKFEEMACNDRVLIEIAALLDAESFYRLWSFTENQSTYINDTRVLVDLSKAWTKTRSYWQLAQLQSVIMCVVADERLR